MIIFVVVKARAFERFKPAMSFRELRNFTEMMRALGYPRMVSVDGFRQPNFDLVADCLHWLIQRYEPHSNIATEWGTETDRVQFLKTSAQLMQSKGRIKLNIKRLYQADGYAVKELLKIASVLYRAMKTSVDDEDDLPASDSLSLRLSDLKGVRDVASDITERGSVLFELLGKEEELREARQRAISRNLEMADVERQIRDSVGQLSGDIRKMEEMIDGLEQDRVNLDGKIEKKKQDLERGDKRLKNMQSARPPIMDEYEKLEGELQELFRVYMERFRNLDYLEHELEVHNRAEQERMDETEKAMKRMQKRLREEELRILRGEQMVDEDAMDDDLMSSQSGSSEDVAPRKGARGGFKGGFDDKPSGRIEGSLNPDSSDSDSAVSDDDVTEDSEGTPISIASGNTDDLIDDDPSDGPSLSDGDGGSDDLGGGSDNDF